MSFELLLPFFRLMDDFVRLFFRMDDLKEPYNRIQYINFDIFLIKILNVLEEYQSLADLQEKVLNTSRQYNSCQTHYVIIYLY